MKSIVYLVVYNNTTVIAIATNKAYANHLIKEDISNDKFNRSEANYSIVEYVANEISTSIYFDIFKF